MPQKDNKTDRAQLHFRLSTERVAQLDELCKTNRRKRGDIIEMLIAEAHSEFKRNPSKRINP